MTKHTYRGDLTIDTGMMESMEMEVTFSFTPATPATYWEPGCGETVEIESVKAFLLPKNRPRVEVELPQWMLELIHHDRLLGVYLIDHANGESQHDEDEAADFRRREARDDAITDACIAAGEA